MKSRKSNLVKVGSVAAAVISGVVGVLVALDYGDANAIVKIGAMLVAIIGWLIGKNIEGIAIEDAARHQNAPTEVVRTQIEALARAAEERAAARVRDLGNQTSAELKKGMEEAIRKLQEAARR